MKKYLICVGNPNDINCWSGTAFHILDAAKQFSYDIEGLRLEPNKLSKFRYLWNFKELALSGHYSGYQYSDFFLNNLFRQSKIKEEDEIIIISHFPLLPPKSNSNNWKVFYYIDATTKQIFDEYKNFKFISQKYRKQVLDKEKFNYKNSKLIFCFSNWTKSSLIKDYDISPDKIKVIPGGANIQTKYQNNNFISQEIPPPPTFRKPLRIGFLGQDWYRKGGPKVLEIVNELNAQSIPAVLRVIGASNQNLPNNQYIQNIGFLSKNKNMTNFISELQSWHFGTLFSEAEAYGISNRECFLFGVPVICNDIGGIRSTFPFDYQKCGNIFDYKKSPNFIANWIAEKIKDYPSYINWRRKIHDIKNEFTWEPAIKKIFKEISIFE